MKRLHIGIKFFILAVCVSLAGGCGKGSKAPSFDRSGYEPCTFSTVERENGLEAFAVSPDGEILAGTAGGSLVSYDLSGAEQQEKTPDSFYGNFCFDGEHCYAYDYNQSAVVELFDDARSPRVITNSILFHTIRNIVALDGKIYVLGIPFTAQNQEKFFAFGMNDFENYGEIVYQIDAEDGSYTTLPLKNITAEYRSEDGKLYFYGWEEKDYILYLYDTKKMKTEAEYRQDAMRNSLAIVVEGGYLFAMTPDAGLIAIDLQDGDEAEIARHVYTMFGNDLQFYRGNLFLYDTMKRTLLRAAFITADGEVEALAGSIGAEGQLSESSAASADPDLPKRDEKITVSGWDEAVRLIKVDVVKKLTGMKTKLIEMPIDYEAAVAELMAGNSEVDIYLLGGDIVSRRCRDLGLYVDLQDSRIISEYLDSCLDSVQGVARLENGEIWMLPLDTSMMVTWYVPENMEHFGLTADNLDTVREYLETMEMLESLQENRGDYQYYCSISTFMTVSDGAYSHDYNDFENGKVNFLTDTYRWLAETLWTGWDMSGPPAHHSPFYSAIEDYTSTDVAIVGATRDLDKSKVIFKTGVASDHLMYQFVADGTINEKLEGWQMMGTPGMDAPEKETGMGLTFAVVNPYSRQKEAAVAYLEGIIAGGAKTRRSAMSVCLKKNLEDYAEIYDISLPAVRDLHELFSRAVCGLGSVWAPYRDYIVEYQQGLITLEQALIKHQRQFEGGLYE
ncbi:MAG: hypothetical protein K2N94_03590 [Lachnospiraceae bacterium]|nr:hypothetical protein [Lachnospiraceae bacterium]